MSSFISADFIRNILRELKAEARVGSEQIQYLMLLVQLQAHHLFQSSVNFMRNDKRQIITSQDVIAASIDNGHTMLILQDNFQRQNENQIIGAENYQLEEQFQALLTMNEIMKPKIQGKWIYIRGKIPALTYNIDLKCLSMQLHQQKLAQNQSRHLVNIIKDDPYSLLTNQQFDYFQQMCSALIQDVKPYGDFTLEGDLNSILPFFLKFLGERQLNSTSVCFLLKLIQNKYIWKAIQYNLKKILNLLLAYRGVYSFEVGNKIAQLVGRFSDKYPILRDIYVKYQDQSYSTILKKISFQLILGISLQLDEGFWETCDSDCKKNNKMAIVCMHTLLSYSSCLQYMKQIFKTKLNQSIYWHPCSELNHDPYLHMF